MRASSLSFELKLQIVPTHTAGSLVSWLVVCGRWRTGRSRNSKVEEKNERNAQHAKHSEKHPLCQTPETSSKCAPKTEYDMNVYIYCSIYVYIMVI